MALSTKIKEQARGVDTWWGSAEVPSEQLGSNRLAKAGAQELLCVPHVTCYSHTMYRHYLFKPMFFLLKKKTIRIQSAHTKTWM